MDPVSHVALAYNLVHLQPHASARRGLIPAALLGSLSPDVDVFLLPTGWDRYMVAHESGTHSILGALVCAALAAGVTRAVYREGRYAAMCGAAVIGAGSHVWFDVFSGATIRVWWPFANLRLSNLGAFAMADPLVAAACCVTAVAIWWRRERRAHIAVIFAAALLLFVAARTATRLHAQTTFAAQVPHAGDTLVLPVWGSLSRWEVYGRDNGAVNQWVVDLRHGSVELAMTVPEAAAASQASIAASLEWDTVRNFRRTHDFAFATTSGSPSAGTRVMWSDLRYCSRSPGADQGPERIACAVSAGGEREASSTHPRLIVSIGDVVQER